MFVELVDVEKNVVRPLLATVDALQALAYAPIEGTSTGRVWVDDDKDPRSALVAATASGSPPLFVLGRADDAGFREGLVALIRQGLSPSSRATSERRHHLIYAFSLEWHEALDEILTTFHTQRVERQVFRLDREAHARLGDWRRRVAPHMTVVEADRKLAESVGGIAEIWGSPEAFVARGVGRFILNTDAPTAGRGQPLSHCVTMFVGGGHAELAVQTIAGHRQRGLGTTVACACIEACLESGIEPAWGCFDNEASANLALGLGFRPAPSVVGHYARVDAMP